MWEGRVWCLREQSKEGPKGRSGQLRSLHPKIWVEKDRGTPTMESMMQRGTRPRRRGFGAACSCSAPPQGFEADAPTASQSLTVSDAPACHGQPDPGSGIPRGQSFQGPGHLCTNHHVAFPEHLPYDHRDPTLSPWYEHRPAWEAKPLGPMTQGVPGMAYPGTWCWAAQAQAIYPP